MSLERCCSCCLINFSDEDGFADTPSFFEGFIKFTLSHISLVNQLFLVPIQHISITDIPFCLSSLSCLLMFATALLAYAISCISACSILSHDPWHCINGTCLCILLHPWSPGSCYTAYALCISDSHFCHTCASNNIC